MKKIILITNIPNPYRVPLFNEMSRQFLAEGIHLKLVFGAGSYKRRLFQLDLNEISFEYEILKDKGHTLSKDGEKTLFLYRGLTKLLRAENPDAIIVAGFSLATMKVLFHKLTNGIPYIIFSGTIETGKASQSIVRKIQRTILLRNAAAFVAYGNKAKKYLVNRGAKEDRVFIGRNTVDTTYFSEQTDRARLKFSSPSEISHLTYLGYLVPRKNVILLLEAIKIVKLQREDFILDIIGDGISRPLLEKYCRDNNLESVIKFHGFRQKNELPDFFAQSSALLFQTDFDIWGLVLNEAMAAGVVCLSSPNAGATHDLITEGKTGFITDFTKSREVADKICWLLDHKEEAATIGRNAAQFIKNNVTISHAVKGFLDAALYAMKNN